MGGPHIRRGGRSPMRRRGGPEKRAFHDGRAPYTTRRAQPDEEEGRPGEEGFPRWEGPIYDEEGAAR
jgi:hypothetical protein